MTEKAEIVYIIQPIENDDYRQLQEEAVSLIESAGAEYAGTIYQPIREVNPATYIGIGKLQELCERLEGLELTVLFNGSLSPSQTKNISNALGGKKVIDRTTLILDIFAKRAETSEGKIQVELAQLKYIYPRLKGSSEALSRLGGGIGTRGPGETQLETDRRHIRTRIDHLERKLKEISQRRKAQITRRKKQNVQTVALVGYTNTGKSTLLNAITGADVFTKDALFATLDPTSRAFEIDNVPFLMVDTVGFLRDLPHNLIEAFQSTLESALNCDLALIVCDAAGDYEMQLETTLHTLKELGFNAPYLVVYNKCDLLVPGALPQNGICISAKKGLGMENLKRRILQALEENYVRTTLSVPFSMLNDYYSKRDLLFEQSTVYTDFGAEITAVIPKIYTSQFAEYHKKV